MKNPPILILLFLCSRLYSQNLILDNFPTKEGLIFYSGVVEVDTSLKSVDLYLNAKDWLVGAFKSAKSVIQVDDKESGVILVRSYFDWGSISTTVAGGPYVIDKKMWFTLKIESKDGRFRYSLYGVHYEAHANVDGYKLDIDKDYEEYINTLDYPKSTKKREEFYQQQKEGCILLNTSLVNLIESLKKSMSTKNSKDW